MPTSFENNTYNTFVNDELPPVLGAVEGPVDSFVLDKQVKDAYKRQAIEDGNLQGADFSDCPAFDELEHKRARQEAKRALEIRHILAEEAGKPSLEDEIIADYAGMEVWRGVLVEASRRSSLARHGLSNDDPEYCRKMIRRAQDELYPAASRDIAMQSLHMFVPKLETLQASGNTDALALVEEVAQKYPFVAEAADVEVTELDPAKRAEIHAALKEKYDVPFAELQAEFGGITPENIVAITDQLLLKVGFAYIDEDGVHHGWRARDVSDKRTGFLANNKLETFDVGNFTTLPTWESYQKVAVHELIHAWRAIRGKEYNTMLGSGLPGSAEVEEGWCMLVEDVWQGNEEPLDRIHYRYSISAYADGAIDGQKHSIDETFQFASKLKAAELMAKRIDNGTPFNMEEVAKSSRKLVFEHIFRAFRGMPEGEVMRKDLAYKAEKVEIVDFINNFEGTGVEAFDYLMRGKFNPLNPKHRQYVNSLEQAA
jgi:hypothetical protein